MSINFANFKGLLFHDSATYETVPVIAMILQHFPQKKTHNSVRFLKMRYIIPQLFEKIPLKWFTILILVVQGILIYPPQFSQHSSVLYENLDKRLVLKAFLEISYLSARPFRLTRTSTGNPVVCRSYTFVRNSKNEKHPETNKFSVIWRENELVDLI